MTLDEARDHIGAGVVYDPGHGAREDGEIVRVLGRVPAMTRRCPQCRARDGAHYPECPIGPLATPPERAETPDAPPQVETLWPENPDTQGD